MIVDFKYQNLNLGRMRIIGVIAILLLIATGILCALFLDSPSISIIADASDEAMFVTKDIKDFNVKFGYQQDPQIMVFEREDVGIGIKIPFENIVWEKTEDSIEASSGDYIFRYSIVEDEQGNSVGIKEDIILSKKSEQTNFEFPINLKNLRPRRIKDIWRFFDKNNTEQFYIPKPFMIDANGEKSEDVEIEIVDNKINIVPNKEWLNDLRRAYPVIIDPSFMITILNVYSHPQAGDYWKVSFNTIGTADLTITPADQATIDDIDFVSLTCDGEERSPEIRENDVIFFPNWSCEGTGEVTHIVNVAAPHIIEFQFNDQIAFAYNSPGDNITTYSNIIIKKYVAPPWLCGDTFIDPRDSETYGTVEIGDQCWMAENLAYDQSAYGGDWCYSDDCATYEATYGRLYDWAAAMQGAASSDTNPSGVQGVCPTDWHLPSDAEYTELTTYLGGESVAGGKMKEVGLIHWNTPNTSADNSSGFTGLPAGYRNTNGSCGDIGGGTGLWSATQFSITFAWYRSLRYNAASVVRLNYVKGLGFSVRCLR